jgi:alanyl-tRNA synthetase
VPSPERLQAIEDEVNREIRLDRRVSGRWVRPEELGTLPVRTRGLPEGFAGSIRLVEIEGLDLNTCGGTHVARLGEIQVLRIVDAAAARGGTRIGFLAGGRVLRELRESAAIEAALKARFGTAREEFAGVLDVREEERKRLDRRVKDLERDLAGRVAAEMAADPAPLLARFVGESGPEFLRAVANAVVARRPDATVALVAAPPDGRDASFLVQSGPGGPEDVSSTGRKLAELLGAKGGGKGRTFEGRGGRWTGDPSLLRSL